MRKYEVSAAESSKTLRVIVKKIDAIIYLNMVNNSSFFESLLGINAEDVDIDVDKEESE